MYPLVPILLLAWWKPDRHLQRLALLLSGLGAAIAAYHVAVERWPALEVTACDVDNPCTIRWVQELGYLTIPAMSLSAFLLVLALLLLDRPRRQP